MANPSVLGRSVDRQTTRQTDAIIIMQGKVNEKGHQYLLHGLRLVLRLVVVLHGGAELRGQILHDQRSDGRVPDGQHLAALQARPTHLRGQMRACGELHAQA